MREGAQHFCPFGPRASSLREDWHVILAIGGDLWPQRVADVNGACIDGVLPSGQCNDSQFVAQSQYDSLITSVDIVIEQGLRDIALLNGCACCATSMARHVAMVDCASIDRRRLHCIIAALFGPLTHNAPGVHRSCG